VRLNARLKACENRTQIDVQYNEHHNRFQLAALEQKQALELTERKRKKVKISNKHHKIPHAHAA